MWMYTLAFLKSKLILKLILHSSVFFWKAVKFMVYTIITSNGVLNLNIKYGMLTTEYL